jgi:hypothetical protein
MNIDVCIPYKENRQLGQAYNRLMKQSKGWVLFLDHDVLLLNQNWYYICQACIKRYGEEAGWITGVTNRIGCHWQRPGIEIDKDNDDIGYHLKMSKKIYDENQGSYFEPADYAPFSGFFILTNKTVWEMVGGFENGWLADNPYDEAVRKGGYKRVVMKELYCYHIKDKKGLYYENSSCV